MSTRDRIIELIRASAQTPLALIRELEQGQQPVRDVRAILLRLMNDGSVEFGVDGKVRLPEPMPAAQATA